VLVIRRSRVPPNETPIGETDVMAFGQQGGPPASARQVQELLTLLGDAGYGGFREARHPFDLTQRQAGGRFTRDEADALIERLRANEADAAAPDLVRSPKEKAAQQVLRVIPAEQLAAELERRGWIVIAP
jgi:hypothetical protein